MNIETEYIYKSFESVNFSTLNNDIISYSTSFIKVSRKIGNQLFQKLKHFLLKIRIVVYNKQDKKVKIIIF